MRWFDSVSCSVCVFLLGLESWHLGRTSIIVIGLFGLLLELENWEMDKMVLVL